MNVSILRRHKAPVNLTPLQARILKDAQAEVRRAGALVREVESWKTSFRWRTGRAA